MDTLNKAGARPQWAASNGIVVGHSKSQRSRKRYFGKGLSRNHCYATLGFLRKILKTANSELSEK